MPNDLERAFGALADDTDRAQLLPAAEVRRLAGRRSRRGSIAAVATVAVLVAGVAVGSRWAMGGGDEQPRPLPPVQSIGVSPAPSTPTPSAAGLPSSPAGLPSSPAGPPPTSKSPPARSIPSSIPARAMLNVKDGNTGEFAEVDTRRPSKLCSGTTYPSSSKAAVRKSVFLLYRAPELPSEYVPDDTIYDTVTVYRGTGAEEFLDDLRAAVRACPNGTGEAKYRSLGSFGAGDQSLLIERSTPAKNPVGEPEPGGEPNLTYIAAARIKDTVALVESTGYENWGSKREVVEKLARTAADRVAAWRD